MPMPKKPGEKQKDFMSRCISHHVDTGRPQKQAVAICYSMWRDGKGKEKAPRPRMTKNS
jgi:hypothetical protein